MRLRNAHTATIDGVPSGAEGDFDVTPGVQVLLDGGLLVSVPQPDLPEGAPSATPAQATRRGRKAAG